MTFSYNNAVPATNNNPSVDQPDMLTNTQSIESLIAVDHVSFNALNGGQHKQVVFNNKNAPGAQTDPQSTLYTGSGTASTVSQLLYKNQNGIFQISAIRAWALCSSAGITASQSINVASVARQFPFPAGVFVVTLTTNAVSSANFGILITSTASATSDALIANYAITGTGTFLLSFTRILGGTPFLADPLSFSFQVLQI